MCVGVGRQAQGVFGMLDIVNRKFDELPSSLEEGFTSTNQSSKYQLYANVIEGLDKVRTLDVWPI